MALAGSGGIDNSGMNAYTSPADEANIHALVISSRILRPMSLVANGRDLLHVVISANHAVTLEISHGRRGVRWLIGRWIRVRRHLNGRYRLGWW